MGRIGRSSGLSSSQSDVLIDPLIDVLSDSWVNSENWFLPVHLVLAAVSPVVSKGASGL